MRDDSRGGELFCLSRRDRACTSSPWPVFSNGGAKTPTHARRWGAGGPGPGHGFITPLSTLFSWARASISQSRERRQARSVQARRHFNARAPALSTSRWSSWKRSRKSRQNPWMELRVEREGAWSRSVGESELLDAAAYEEKCGMGLFQAQEARVPSVRVASALEAGEVDDEALDVVGVFLGDLSARPGACSERMDAEVKTLGGQPEMREIASTTHQEHESA